MLNATTSDLRELSGNAIAELVAKNLLSEHSLKRLELIQNPPDNLPTYIKLGRIFTPCRRDDCSSTLVRRSDAAAMAKAQELIEKDGWPVSYKDKSRELSNFRDGDGYMQRITPKLPEHIKHFQGFELETQYMLLQRYQMTTG
jgi:hypothetical protein